MDRGYLRYPALRGDTVAFVSDDDLWLVPATGGVARRLTAGLAEPSHPAFSPDGKWLAFVGRDEQHPEVYLMPADGGVARRMTWLGPDVIVRGWTPEGRILFVSTYGQPFFRNYLAYTLDPAGGSPELLPLGQVNHLAFGPRNAKVIGRNTADPARWKRYRGGTAGHLWIDGEGAGQFRRMSELTGNITSPLWIGERVYYLGDAEGVGNLYSCLPDGRDHRRHTDHADHYARNATSDGRRIVYQCGADIWLFDPSRDSTARIDIRLPAHRTQAARKFVPATEHLGNVGVHPAGHSIVVDARGKLFAFALWEGAVRQLGEEQGARYRHAQWLADGETIVAVSDATGEERVEIFTASGSQPLPWDVGRVVALAASPRDKRIAIANHRNEVLVGDIDAGTLTKADHSAYGRMDSVVWSPDGAWVAYPFATTARHAAIKMYELASGMATLVTAPEFRDYSPAFDPEGRYLYFLSLRTFDPVYDAVQFELSFPRAARPYLIALQAGGRPPFEPLPKGLAADDPAAKAAANAGVAAVAGVAASPAKAMRVDLDGIVQRVVAFPVPEGKYGEIAGVAGGKVLWTSLPIVGAHGRGGHKQTHGKLEAFDFATLRAETLMDKVSGFTVASDRTTVVVRSDRKLRAIAATRPPDADRDPAVAAETPSRKTGWIDLERVRVSVDPKREWKQMLREVWRLQRDQFWVESMSGVDWNAMYERYAPLLERVSTRAELSDLIWEMQGELGTSHAYEMGGDYRKPPQIALGYLAADTRPRGDGSYEIVRVVRGDPWDPGADSPLNAVGAEVTPGERIVAVNGQRVSRERPPEALLVHQAGTRVELALEKGEGDAITVRNVLVTTLTDEVPARYREWVEAKRAWVHAHSNGRVGYFHVPDMQSAGFAEFHRYFGAECERDALIIDVRYNRGGHVSQLLLEKVRRQRIGYDVTRWGVPQSYPDQAVAGPVVAVTNEHAGSDGDIFSHAFKLFGIGPLVGTRTWGGVIGIYPRHTLVDGTQTTQPEFSFWFRDVGWGVENYGTDPDIEIDNAPQDAAADRDAQLELALKTALDLAEKAPATWPDFGNKPNLACPVLPPR